MFLYYEMCVFVLSALGIYYVTNKRIVLFLVSILWGLVKRKM